MAADPTLVRGAYAAAGGGIKDYGLAASKGMTAISKDISSRVSGELEGRKNKFNEFAEWELTRTPGMTDMEIDGKANELMEMKKDFMTHPRYLILLEEKALIHSLRVYYMTTQQILLIDLGLQN